MCEPYAASSIRQIHAILSGALGIDTQLKQLRHYSATELLTARVDLRTVAQPPQPWRRHHHVAPLRRLGGLRRSSGRQGHRIPYAVAGCAARGKLNSDNYWKCSAADSTVAREAATLSPNSSWTHLTPRT